LQKALASASDGTGTVVVGTLDDHVVGYAVASLRSRHDTGRVASISELFVEPAARCVGVGEAVMDAVVRWAEANGCVGVDASVLPGNRAAKNFFERFGLTARAILVHRSLRGAAGERDDQ